MKKERNDYIDYIKGLLILLVVCGHTIQYFAYSNNAEGFYNDSLFKISYIFHMPLFMAVSGFVSFNSIKRKSAYKSISDRFYQLIIPILYSSILFKSAQYFVHVSLNLSITELLLELAKSIIYDFLTNFWFLWSVFASTIVVVILKKLNVDNFLFFILVSFLLILLPDFGSIYLFKFTFPFFCAGYFFAKKSNLLSEQKITSKKVFFSLLISLICFLLWKEETYIYVTRMYFVNGNYLNIALRYCGGSILSITFVILSFLQYRRSKFPLINELGKNSLAIYILQTYMVERFFAMVKVQKIFSLVFANHILLKLFLSPFIAIAMCLIAYYLAKFLYRYSLISKLFLGTYSKSNT